MQNFLSWPYIVLFLIDVLILTKKLLQRQFLPAFPRPDVIQTGIRKTKIAPWYTHKPEAISPSLTPLVFERFLPSLVSVGKFNRALKSRVKNEKDSLKKRTK